MICVPLEGLSETDKFPSINYQITNSDTDTETSMCKISCVLTPLVRHTNMTQHYTTKMSEIGMMLKNVKTFFPRPVGKIFWWKFS